MLSHNALKIKITDMNLDTVTYDYIYKLFKGCNLAEFRLLEFTLGMGRVAELPRYEVLNFIETMLAKQANNNKKGEIK